MIKHNRKTLQLRTETVRNLATTDLALVAGGERASGPPDLCIPASIGAPSCTGTCGQTCGFTCGGACDLYTF